MEIRRAVDLDCESIRALLTEWQGEKAELSDTIFKAYLDRDRQYLAVAQSEDDQVVGFIGWTVWRSVLSWRKPTCFIEELFVTESRRCSGIGRALVEHVRNWAVAEGIHAVHLETSEEPALHLYEKMGFTAINTSLYWWSPKR